MNSISELDLQRLVDGELSDKEQQDLLTACEAMSGGQGWRQIALAFLENQIWGSALQKFSAGNFDPASDQVEQPGMSQPLRSARQAVWPWYSIAVGLMVGLLSGWTILQLAPQPAVPQIAEANSLTNDPTPDGQGHFESESIEPLMVLDVKGADGSLRQLPIFDPDAAQKVPYFSERSQLSPEVIQQLESHGYTFDRQRYFYRLPMNDGREVIIPSDRFQLRHIVQ